ncbi:MAG: hypothetical protein IKB97_02865 [Bacteroidaceae bacterium]|nr:hypothetical protein [Bacteroidaceae bacterium]MBR3594883.1 hypothetical protein [Candidatus Saccharibacteria bacterium]MBR6122168.1 hypothetical protein [Candidatus Saccharibacteria bacterium]
MKINSKIEEGEARIHEFAQDLVERNKVPEEQRDAEVEKLEGMIRERVINETLTALPEEDWDEIEETVENEGELSVDKWNSMMFMERIRPESITTKVFREVEQEYLGVENVKEEENE